MGASEGRGRLGRGLVALIATLGCRSAGPLPPAPPAAAEPPPGAPTAAEAGPSTEIEPPATSPPAVKDLVVIERAGEAPPAAPPPSLYEASVKARAERASRQGHATRVVTDETLAEQAARGEVTAAEIPPPAPIEQTAATPAQASGAEALAEPGEPPAEEPEPYWRRRVRDARGRWRAAVERVAELEDEAARLRWDFYATDDPFYRDAQIKPAWDRALAQLEAARGDAEFEHRGVELVLEEGRRAGALPGWLREGLELEPTAPAERDRELPEHRVGEPVPAEEPDGWPR